MKNYKRTVITPGLSFQIEIDGVKWLLRKVDYEDLKFADSQGYHVSDWAWFNAKYQAYCVHKDMHFFVSNSYIKDIKEIMGIA